MNRCNQALLNEYPHLFMFCEASVHSVPSQSYFAENNMNTSFKSDLPSVIDFQLLFSGIAPALKEGKDGLNRIYEVVSQDFLYRHPEKLVTLLDNHDLTRFYSEIGEDIRKQKIGFGWLLTFRGIPQLYYGSEVLMKDKPSPRDGHVRLNFPGGWNSDTKNAFTGAGLQADEKDMLLFVKTLGQFRKNSSALATGKMIQYAPTEGRYVYFRQDEKQTIMVVMNVGDKASVSLSNYSEVTRGFSAAKNVITQEPTGATIAIEPMTITILELIK